MTAQPHCASACTCPRARNCHSQQHTSVPDATPLQAPTLPLPSAASFAWGLPPTLCTLELSHPPLQPGAALALPAKLPLLHRFVLVW